MTVATTAPPASSPFFARSAARTADAVAVNQASLLVGHQDPVGVSIQGDPQISAVLKHGSSHSQGAAPRRRH